jgi:hypothetical protein
MISDPNLATMDARSLVVAVLFGFIGGLLVPREGDDRRAVLVTLALVTVIGVVVWMLADDAIAGPSLTVGGVSTLIGAMIKRIRTVPEGTRT